MSIEQIRAYWNTTELVVEEAIVAAEGLQGKSGAEKKQFVKETVEGFLKNLEGKFNIIPDSVEPLVFHGIDFALGFIIDRVFARLDKAGVVNVPASTPAAA